MVDSCKPVEPLELRYQEWDPDLGPLRRTARSAETLDDAGVLEPREDAIEHAVMKSERPVHRDVESVLSIVGKGERPVLTRAIRTLKERWGKWVGSDRELVMPVAPPGESDDPGTGSTSGKRWITLEDEAFIEKATVNGEVYSLFQLDVSNT
ncbi:hypothetical protein IMSHALPRED_002640 [Imshaugia aleurites]|uniref:Uncharacterized protein n=1 Tax=Imshaugia aleurites TaxID=172621 RepID=A0A8H3EZW4_9LECA|nr:hypothetical protein IMSHALPRED_002640 [Imshaugia aleurites]